MKRRMRNLAAFLVLVMVVTCVPASAAGNGSLGFSSLSDWWEALVSMLTGGDDSEKSPSGEVGEAIANVSENGEAHLELVEDETTVTDGTVLRADTYQVDNLEALANGDTVRYFDVTLYNYDTEKINQATRILEAEAALASGTHYLEEWKGLYFSSGGPNRRDGLYNAIPLRENIVSGSANYESATSVSAYSYSWSGHSYNGTHIGDGIYYFEDYENSDYYCFVNNEYINLVNLKYDSNSRSWLVNNRYNGGNNRYITLYRLSSAHDTVTTGGYAAYNFWTGNISASDSQGGTPNGNFIYSGLVQNTLTSDGQIQFNMPQAGLFDTTSTEYRDVYTSVGLPFVYNSEDKSYSFDSSEMGAYFSGTPESNTDLTYSVTPQNNDTEYADGSTTVWMPFNNGSVSGEENCDYHFGMRASIPFTMTSTGTLNNAENGTPITFEFSGDDDVWVFIDGQLVLDLGGIHNCMGGNLNFQENTWTVMLGSGNTKEEDSIGDVSGGSLSGRLFNEGNETGILNQTRETFAATDTHQLTVFYLERGAGSSNCKIKFNLPMNDTVSVTKNVNTKDSSNMDLSEEVIQSINNREFTFKLYKDGVALSRANYRVVNSEGTYLRSATTAADGRFTLKNGETAEFTEEIGTNSKFYVEEIFSSTDAGAWDSAVFTQTIRAANGFSEDNVTASAYCSMTVTASGSEEAEDSIAFTCSNTLKHVDASSLVMQDDRIVIDYGLPVEIDVLANDTAIGGVKSVISVQEQGTFGNASLTEDGTIRYELTKPMTGVEKLTYTAKLTDPAGPEFDKEEEATVYIIPATSMYYEEDFDLGEWIRFTGGVGEGWQSVVTEGAQNDCQETGIVGDANDSPYGSDEAYLTSLGDSNGTSMYVNTDGAAAGFTYKFSGTGTAFFARTTNNSGYMRVVIKDSSDAVVYSLYRDTAYKTEADDTVLYNIPVFNWSSEDGKYDTYTVEVSIANVQIAEGYGSKFWLDGIRVYNPVSPEDPDMEGIVDPAYSADNEANNTVVTLREKLIADATKVDEDGNLQWSEQDISNNNFVVFTDTNGAIVEASDYVSDGPKEELYLNDGQKVRFSLYNWDTNANRIYLGIKAPMGNGGTVRINRTRLPINNTVDCYYDISDYVEITYDTTSIPGTSIPIATYEIEAIGAVISVTNIKVAGPVSFTIVTGGSDSNVDGSEGQQDEENTDVDVEVDGSENISVYEGQESGVKKVQKSFSEKVILEENALEETVSDEIGSEETNAEVSVNSVETDSAEVLKEGEE